jgi:uroporphyrin-III C-methyltransferase
LGETCALLGTLRTQLQSEDGLPIDRIDDDAEQSKDLNSLILDEEDYQTSKTRRMRWLTQICEYYPLSKLTQLSSSDIANLLDQYRQDEGYISSSSDIAVPELPKRRGTIALVGAGPGHPDLLTQAALRAINTADLILADKLVPSEILALIPRRTEVYIARKFPGNAEKAQEELQSKGLTALHEGKRVIRLKQGDPYIFGRGGEEFLFFKEHGYEVLVIPGLTSALTGMALAGITATHRGVADQVIICTGTGRRGALPQLPEYTKTKTVIFLMTLHRIEELITSLVTMGWPDEIPCAVVERASCRDQRVIRTTIMHVAKAVESEGSRPPGLLVVGWTCCVLNEQGKGDWIVEEGLHGSLWSNVNNSIEIEEK